MRAWLVGWLSEEHLLIGAGLARVLLGAWAVYYYAHFWRDRHFLWGPDGIIPFARFADSMPFLNVLALNPSPFYFDVVYVAAMVIAVLTTIGLWSRLVVPLHWVLIWSFQNRNELIGDGGDNFMRLALFFLIFVNTAACFSFDGLRTARGRSRGRLSYVLEPVRAISHNFGVLAIIGQLSFLYMSTGMYKVMGELWQNGTALYYILRVDEFSWPGVAEYIYRNPYLIVGGTYGTVLFEVLFAPGLLNRWSRVLFVIPAGIFFHVGIAAVMGLTTFAWSMLSVYPFLVTDHEYLEVIARLRRRWRLDLYYDGWCPLCIRSVTWLRRLDLLGLVHYVSFRDPGAPVDLTRAERRMQSVDSGGHVREGMDALIQIAARTVVLWPFLPLLLFLRALLGHRAYDFIASRRFALLPGACQEHCEAAGIPR